MKFIVHKEDLEKFQAQLMGSGYGQGGVKQMPGNEVIVEVYHDQLDTKKNMLSHFRAARLRVR